MRIWRLTALCATILLVLAGCRDKNSNITDVEIDIGDKDALITTHGSTVLYSPDCVVPGQRSLVLNAGVPSIWSVSPSGVVSVEVTSNGVTAIVRSVAEGEATITAVPKDGEGEADQIVITVICPSSPPGPQTRTIDLAPNGASGQVGTTLQTSAICRIDGSVVTSCNPHWFSSNPSNVSVNPNTGLITFVSPGSATVCVQWSESETQPQDCETYTTTGISTPTFAITPNTGSIYPQSCPASGNSTTQLTYLVNGSPVTSGVVWVSSQSNAAQVSNSGLVTGFQPGTVTITASGGGGSATAVITVNQCQSTPSTPTITGITLNVSPQTVTSCPTTITITATVQGTGAFNQNATLTASSGTLTQTGANAWTWNATSSGSVTFISTAVGDPSRTATRTVSINCPVAPSVVSVDVEPEAQSCALGGQMVFNGGVEVTGNASKRLIWTVSNPSVASVRSISSDTNTLILDCNSVGTVTVTARAEADQSVSDSVTGTVTTGNFVCTFVVAGHTPATDGSITIARNVDIAVSGICENENGVRRPPFWFSSNNSVAQIRGADRVTIDGVEYGQGYAAFLWGVYSGESVITVQASIEETSPSFSRRIIVQ